MSSSVATEDDAIEEDASSSNAMEEDASSSDAMEDDAKEDDVRTRPTPTRRRTARLSRTRPTVSSSLRGLPPFSLWRASSRRQHAARLSDLCPGA